MQRTPLEDPAYEPKHPPINGRIPDVVAKWGPRSQLRWFTRFNTQLAPQRGDIWERYYVHSEHHRGTCCTSCQEDQYAGYYDVESCCCEGDRALREREEQR